MFLRVHQSDSNHNRKFTKSQLHDHLKVECWDYDHLKKDDFLGEARIEVKKLQSLWSKDFDLLGEKCTGKIKLACQFSHLELVPGVRLPPPDEESSPQDTTLDSVNSFTSSLHHFKEPVHTAQYLYRHISPNDLWEKIKAMNSEVQRDVKFDGDQYRVLFLHEKRGAFVRFEENGTSTSLYAVWDA